MAVDGGANKRIFGERMVLLKVNAILTALPFPLESGVSHLLHARHRPMLIAPGTAL